MNDQHAYEAVRTQGTLWLRATLGAQTLCSANMSTCPEYNFQGLSRDPPLPRPVLNDDQSNVKGDPELRCTLTSISFLVKDPKPLLHAR